MATVPSTVDDLSWNVRITTPSTTAKTSVATARRNLPAWRSRSSVGHAAIRRSNAGLTTVAVAARFAPTIASTVPTGLVVAGLLRSFLADLLGVLGRDAQHRPQEFLRVDVGEVVAIWHLLLGHGPHVNRLRTSLDGSEL